LIVGGSDADSLGGVLAVNYARVDQGNTFTVGTQTFESPNQLIEVNSSKARLHVGTPSGGQGGTLGSMIYDGEGGTTLSHGMYIAYDCYMNPNTDLWAANETTTGNKWVQTMGNHTNAVNFYRFDGDVTQEWKTSDMDLMFAIEDDKIYCGNSIEAHSFVSKETNSTHILAPEGGSLHLNNVTGAIQIKLPKSNTNTMLTIVIQVYDFNLSQSFDIRVGGFTGSAGWLNSKIDVDGAGNYDISNVRVGWDASGDNCIWVGELASAWANTTVTVKSVTASYTNFDLGWDKDWIISLNATAFTTVHNDHLTGKQIERIGLLGFKNGVRFEDDTATSIDFTAGGSVGHIRLNTTAGLQGSLYCASGAVGLLDSSLRWAFQVINGGDSTRMMSGGLIRLAAHSTGVSISGLLTLKNTDGNFEHSLGVTSDKDSFYKSSDSAENRMFWKDGSDNTVGAILGTSAGNFGMLDADGNWGVRIETDVETSLYVNNVKRLSANTEGVDITGTLTQNGGEDLQSQIEDATAIAMLAALM